MNCALGGLSSQRKRPNVAPSAGVVIVTVGAVVSIVVFNSTDRLSLDWLRGDEIGSAIAVEIRDRHRARVDTGREARGRRRNSPPRYASSPTRRRRSRRRLATAGRPSPSTSPIASEIRLVRRIVAVSSATVAPQPECCRCRHWRWRVRPAIAVEIVDRHRGRGAAGSVARRRRNATRRRYPDQHLDTLRAVTVRRRRAQHPALAAVELVHRQRGRPISCRMFTGAACSAGHRQRHSVAPPDAEVSDRTRQAGHRRRNRPPPRRTRPRGRRSRSAESPGVVSSSDRIRQRRQVGGDEVELPSPSKSPTATPTASLFTG